MRLFALIAAFVLWSGQTDDHDADSEPFAEVLQRIVRASRENLRPLKASRIEKYPGRDYWYDAQTTLPGAQICRVYEHPEMVYRCEWKREAGQTPRSVYETADRQFEEALGPTDWHVRRSSTGAVRTRFEPVNPRRHPLIEITLLAASTVEVKIYAVRRWDDQD